MNRDEILKFLKSDKENISNNFGVVKLALFGSFSRGDETSESDIDIVVDMKRNNYFKLIR